MLLCELLKEARDDFLVQQHGAAVAELANRQGIKLDGPGAIAKLREADPTPNGKYFQWIIKQYLSKLFRLEDTPRVREQLIQFGELARRNRLEQKDINKYTYRTLVDALDQAASPTPTNPPTAAPLVNTKGSVVLYQGPLGVLAVPLTKDASCVLGRGTSWCTARTDSDNMYDNYAPDGSLFVWIGSAKEKYQFHVPGVFHDHTTPSAEGETNFGWFMNQVLEIRSPGYLDNDGDSDSIQFMDRKDQPIEPEVLQKLRRHPVLSKMFDHFEKSLKEIGDLFLSMQYYNTMGMDVPDGALEGRSTAQTMVVQAAMAAADGEEVTLPIEQRRKLMVSPGYAAIYAIVAEKRWPRIERPLFLQRKGALSDVYDSYKDMFELTDYDMAGGEAATDAPPATASELWRKYEYSQKTPSAAELEVIMKSPEYASIWALEKMGRKRWPEAEKYIIQDIDRAAWYANAIKFRWPELEKAILKSNSVYAKALYASRFFGGKWPAAEASLKPDQKEKYHKDLKHFSRDR